MSGVLFGGALVPVDGLTIIPPASHGGPAWCALHPDDYAMRRTTWIRQGILHSTGGNWPQPVLPGAGPAGHARQIAEMWSGCDRGGGERVHSGAQMVVDLDGSIACLCDLETIAAYHAEASNDWSIGIEMSTRPDGGIYQATIDAAARLVAALCRLVGIPEQMPRGPYRGDPLLRMEVTDHDHRVQLGGPDVVGVLGHRDNTSQRGRGDPGDAIWTALAALGFEGLDYAGGEDLLKGRVRQQALNASGGALKVDGLIGPASLAEARRQGFARWRDVPG